MGFFDMLKGAFESGAVKQGVDAYYTNKARTAEDEDDRERAQRALQIGQFFDTMNDYRKTQEVEKVGDDYASSYNNIFNEKHEDGSAQMASLLAQKQKNQTEIRTNFSGKQQESLLAMDNDAFNKTYGDTNKMQLAETRKQAMMEAKRKQSNLMRDQKMLQEAVGIMEKAKENGATQEELDSLMGKIESKIAVTSTKADTTIKSFKTATKNFRNKENSLDKTESQMTGEEKIEFAKKQTTAREQAKFDVKKTNLDATAYRNLPAKERLKAKKAEVSLKALQEENKLIIKEGQNAKEALRDFSIIEKDLDALFKDWHDLPDNVKGPIDASAIGRGTMLKKLQLGKGGKEASAYEGVMKGQLGGFARNLSQEKGVLNEGDIERVVGLMPRLNDEAGTVESKKNKIIGLIKRRIKEKQEAVTESEKVLLDAENEFNKYIGKSKEKTSDLGGYLKDLGY